MNPMPFLPGNLSCSGVNFEGAANEMELRKSDERSRVGRVFINRGKFSEGWFVRAEVGAR